MIKEFLRKYKMLFYFLKGIKKVFVETFNPLKRPSFEGWYGLSTYTQPPWESFLPNVKSLESNFYQTDCEIRKLMNDKSFVLLRQDLLKTLDLMDKLRWRNYIVFWSFIFAAKSTESNLKQYVEAGVADGISAFYAINAAISYNYKFKGYLYDTWGEVKMDNPSTRGVELGYSCLDLAIVKKNFSKYEDDLVFKKGKIPDTFTGIDEPSSIMWLSIDLNSVKPTIDTLDYFWPRLESGGVVLLDDYGQPAYIDTKVAIEEWMSKRSDAISLHLPTTQGLIIKTK